MIIIGNFPWGKGCPQKKIFNKACEKGKVYSLQPVGSWRTRVGNICELLPLHTSKEEFGIAIMPLAIHTNVEDDIVEWDVSKVPTCADLPDGNERQPLKVGSNFQGTDKLKNPVVIGDKQPLKVNDVHTGYGHGGITSSICIKQPLNTGNYVDHRGIYSNGATVKQESKNVIYFNTKKERTNFIRNIGKVIPLQMLFYSGLFPTPKQRILPPLDREYTLDELLEYFNFPKDAYDEFNDMTQEEEYRVSYERWKTVRKEKYNLDWEEE